ncbi:DNA internalization-related competence protein ComEC/Rec2 [Variovorax sp. J22P168]|uniref:DNA internalization-related competence protein ComEC/Rec2 n=1 Tax=Variovorax jilinensis TaxID=3053513 RepID=UPI0025777789|nr:DNA internalization-related competence protein ComEC/Rec2 [Variovorax sp. J22P168]MDM0013045.1 DNA internalization-related competence protein ComEC/Rec2 [Variovorax sp. J22P168]
MAGSVLGAALQLQQPSLWHAGAYALLLLASGALGWTAWRRRRWPMALSLCVALLLGALAGFGAAGWRASAYAAGAMPPEIEGRDLLVEGRVASMPQLGAAGIRFVFDIDSAHWAKAGEDEEAMPAFAPSRVMLAWYDARIGPWARPGAESVPPGPVHAGERWRFTVRLRAPHGSLNPHGFDHELRMWERGERATGQVRDGARDPRPERLGTGWGDPVERLRGSVRDRIVAQVADARLAGVIAALVTGEQNAIDRADWDIFRITGVAHLVSISGLHITMFAWLAMRVVGWLWRRNGRLMLAWPAPHAALVGGVLLATLYALFSGWGVPAQRTIVMLAAIALLRLTGRRWPWPFVWLLACALVVALDPWALMQAGFWLSFVAVGVLFAGSAGGPDGAPAGFGARALRLLREQWMVTLALTPLTLLLFQQVSLVGLAANAVAIPWVTLVVTPLAMLGTLAPALWQLAAASVQLMLWLLQWMADWPFAALSMAAPPLWRAVAGIAGGVLIAMRLPAAMRLMGLPLLLPVLFWQPPRPAQGEFELLAADIGQGGAVLVRTASHSLLYDTGPRYGLDSDAGDRVLVPLLRALGERLDLVVLSHRDADHTGGAEAVLAAQPQARLLSSIEAGHPLQAVRPSQRCEAGQRWQWDGVDFELLHPQPGDYASFVAPKPNAISCVLRIGNRRATALLAGDIERLQEGALVERAAGGLRADVLLVPHHGSKTSSTAQLLDAVRPQLALVQSGWRNRFGHPAAEVPARYEARGIEVVRSTHCGAAAWSSLEPGRVACERQRRARYWQHAVP